MSMIFCHFFIPQWEQFCLDNGYRLRRRQGHMYPSEIMTILIRFHLSHYRNFKAFYLEFLWKYHHNDFPTLLSYTRFVSVAPFVLVPLCSQGGIPLCLFFIRVCCFRRLRLTRLNNAICAAPTGSLMLSSSSRKTTSSIQCN